MQTAVAPGPGMLMQSGMKPRRPAVDPEAVVLVTGASTGLGLALARRLVATRHRLILTARAESLERFAREGIRENGRVWLRPLDVALAAERARAVAEAEARWGGVDVLVNNAGVAYRTVVEHMTDRGQTDQLNINFRGPMELIRLVLPGMRAKRAGRIINVSSVGGMMAMPTMALYSASKFALEGASEALWYEVRPWNIRVTLVEPGFIHSRSFENTRFTRPSEWSSRHADDPYHAHYEHMGGMIARRMERSGATPERVAAVILRTLRQRRPPLIVAGTRDAYLFALLRRFLPRGLYHRVLYACLPRVREWGDGKTG